MNTDKYCSDRDLSRSIELRCVIFWYDIHVWLRRRAQRRLVRRGNIGAAATLRQFWSHFFEKVCNSGLSRLDSGHKVTESPSVDRQ